jgi:hypothetical protein
VSDESFLESFNSLRSHAIRNDQQNKERSARQIHNTFRSPGTVTIKKVKVEIVQGLINELQAQDSVGSDDALKTLTFTKNEMVFKLAQVPPEIWIKLSVEAKK